MTLPDLHPIEASYLHARRERCFLLVAGIFLGSLAMLNILGVSRFVVLFSLSTADGNYELTWGQWGQINFALAIGVLPYPITFLCTDIISEFYGRKRANWVVAVGFVLNLWVVLILWLGGVLPAQPDFDEQGLPKIAIAERDGGESAVGQASPDSAPTLESEAKAVNEDLNQRYLVDVPDAYAFYKIRQLAFGAVAASMLAYLAAQFCDVYLFHFWKKLTKGRHLWLRNNGSTLISQLVDTTAVILITHYYASALPIDKTQTLLPQLALFVATSYVFKLLVALLDTIPFYLAVGFLSNYLEFDPFQETNSAKK